jgi:uracil-DNA glycosylase
MSISSILLSDINLEASWKEQLRDEFSKDYFISLRQFLEFERESGRRIFPPENQIFAAFDNTPFDQVKVVILGQDPYHGEGQGNGLSFSVNEGIRKPPSLLNIFKELKEDLGIPVPQNGNLDSWAKQGVLLLNATLTVRANEAASHQSKGWEIFTDAVIQKLSANKSGIIFLLWGRFAQSKEALIDHSKHKVLKAAHPSPLARTGFIGCRHFSKTNELLMGFGKAAIDWGAGLK